jgi:plasmid stability protein
MRNITVSLDEDLVRRAKIRAAMEDSSVSAVVRRFLEDYARTETEFERLRQKEIDLRRQIKDFDATDRLSRDELYDRRR